MVTDIAHDPAPVREPTPDHRDRAAQPLRHQRFGQIVEPGADLGRPRSPWPIVVIYPLLWMVFSSFKDNSEVFGRPVGSARRSCAGTTSSTAGNAGVVRYFTNSVIVTAASILTTTLFSAWAAYGLVRVQGAARRPDPAASCSAA